MEWVSKFTVPLVAHLVEALCYNCRVSGLILDLVIEIFHRHNPSGRTVALGSTQFLTESSREGGVKAAGAWVRQPYNLHVPTVYISW